MKSVQFGITLEVYESLSMYALIFIAISFIIFMFFGFAFAIFMFYRDYRNYLKAVETENVAVIKV